MDIILIGKPLISTTYLVVTLLGFNIKGLWKIKLHKSMEKIIGWTDLGQSVLT